MTQTARLPMTIFSLLLLALSWGPGAPAWAQAPQAGGGDAEITRLSVEFLPAAAAEDAPHSVTVQFDGRTYGEDAWFSRLKARAEAGEVALSEVQSFLVEAMEVYRQGSLEEVAELWLPEDRAKLLELFEDPEIFSRNQTFYRNLSDSAFVAEVLYGPSYVLVFVQHSGEGFEDFIKEYPLIRNDGELYLTNRLQADPVFMYFTTAFKEDLDLRQPPRAGDDTEGGDDGASSR